jgi:hypothetical protein
MDVLGVLNVDIVGLVSFKCMVDDWFSSSNTGTLFGFWWSMHIQIAFPIFLLLVTMLTSRYRMMKCARTCAKIRAAMTLQGAGEEEIEDAEDDEYSDAQTYQLSVYAIFGGEVRINRSTYQVKPFCLSSETVLHIKPNRSTYQAKPFYLSSQTVLSIKPNRSTFEIQLVTLQFGFIISYIHPSTATTLFKAFDCSNVKNLPDTSGESWLNMDVSEMCFTEVGLCTLNPVDT